MKFGRKWVIIISSILLMEGVALLGLSAIGKEKAWADKSNRDTARSPGLGIGQEESVEQKNRGEKKVLTIYEKNKENLVLVNADTALDTSFDADLQTICNGRLYASSRLYSSLTKMLKAAGQNGFRYWIASAWRSRDKQQQLVDEDVQALLQKGISYDEALRQTYVETMPAGHSEHETGLALDILCSGNTDMNISQAKEPGNIWLRKNCYRYGFIPRYPKDKEDITGINYEPWHFRYVGREAALYMQKHHLTLEEFWEKLG